ncbi:DUF535 domain-containing protein [Pseudoduganella sp. FT93W]|uniref:DUF535 domain-containing protein n=1 Tax=Duganella fentianensis TaxID=2692177 RepID=A0A845HZ01_9BURK|nr:DUF535 family protein [Duganella fentianensis]MYN44775.1 DUF535 domain-containing protein [Duganella fentianensis]
MPEQITIRSAVTHLSGWQRTSAFIKLGLRATYNWRISKAWLILINSHPLLRELSQRKPRLILKVYRPYLSLALPAVQRLEALRDHYCFVLASGLGPLTLLAARRPAILANTLGKSGSQLQLRLAAVDPMEREGELVIQLYKDSELICSCAFSFIAGEHGMVLAIGCLQGPKVPHGRQLVRTTTRELHGLRPKTLLVRLLAHLGHHQRCAGVRLVGNKNRVVLAALKKGKVHADYDALWRELQAYPRLDGDFELACEQIQAPCLITIPSKKRAEVRRRHEMLETLARTVCGVITRSSA